MKLKNEKKNLKEIKRENYCSLRVYKIMKKHKKS